MVVLFYTPPRQIELDAGLVEVDLDPSAERYSVLDRITMGLIFTGFKPESGNARIIVPLKYTIDYNLMVLILDDAGDPLSYVAGNDKVQAELVDARTVILNP